MRCTFSNVLVMMAVVMAVITVVHGITPVLVVTDPQHSAIYGSNGTEWFSWWTNLGITPGPVAAGKWGFGDVYAFWTAAQGSRYSDTVFYQNFDKPTPAGSAYTLAVPRPGSSIVAMCAGFSRLTVITEDGTVSTCISGTWENRWVVFNSTGSWPRFSSCAMVDRSHVLLTAPNMMGSLLDLEFESNKVAVVPFTTAAEVPLFVSVYKGVGAVITQSHLVVSPVRNWQSPVAKMINVVPQGVVAMAVGNTDRSIYAATSQGVLRLANGEQQWDKVFGSPIGGLAAPSIES